MGLALGGRKMFGRMLGNKWTTAIGAVIGLFVTLSQLGVLPPAVSAQLPVVIGVAAALGFVVAKDATTGSEPGATK
jgi:uncharacterized protein YqgC (DUF456 family)